jgi:predicted ATPase
MDTGVILLGFVAWTLWFLGYPDQAQERSHEVLTLAQELAHPYSLAWALIYVVWFHQFRREGQAAQARAEAAMTLATEQGFAQIAACGTISRGWALAEQGKRAEGMRQMRQGQAALRAMGAETMQSWVLALLAEAHEKGGQAAEGLALLAEAFAVVDKNDEHFYEAELYRLQGELTLHQCNGQGATCQVANPRALSPHSQAEAEAEACFLKAIDIARKQQAKSLELRAVRSLARLWQHQGKRQEAYDLLAPVYHWFTEGFDTADLMDAQALLHVLERGQK